MPRSTLGPADVIRRVLGAVWTAWTQGINQQLAGISLVSATKNLAFPNTNAQTSSVLTIAVTNAAIGNPVVLAPPAAPDANSDYTAYVSAAGVVTVRFNNYSAGAIHPAAANFTVTVLET